MIYEYEIHRLTNESSYHTSLNDNREKQLNELGKAGWEIKSSYADSGNIYVIMSRPDRTKGSITKINNKGD